MRKIKNIIAVAIYMCLVSIASAQDAKEYFEKGVASSKAGNFEEAIRHFDKSIELKNDEFVVWYNRGIAKSRLRKYEASILDFNQAIILNPNYKKAFNARACARQDITDYEGAMSDFELAIQLDEKYIDALYNRGALSELLGKTDEACKDFQLAFDLGDGEAEKKVKKCKDKSSWKTYSILRLVKTAESDKYGFDPEQPVKVGPGPDGGPANERAYLNLLRDSKGNPIDYRRTGSCCDYKSENGFMGLAKLDKYEIIYINEKGKETRAEVYISMYDYEEPMILKGFKTVGR